MSDTAIRVDNLWKEYRLGVINHHTLSSDVQSWWAKIRGKEDPNTAIPSSTSSFLTPNLSQHEDFFWALQDISFQVKHGEIMGIIGRNGAGKSTLLKILSQITAPTKGEVRFKGRIASLLEVGTGFHPELTGRENIFLNGAILGMNKADIRKKFNEIVAFAEVGKFIDTPVKRYSSGMYVRLAFAVAAHLEPEILIIDEVLAVGDAAFQKKCLGKMQEVGRQGRTVLFVSHNMGAIKNLCDRVLLVETGRLVSSGSAGSVINDYLRDLEDVNVNSSIESIEDRSGNGMAIFSRFSVENEYGQIINKILTGEDVIFVFKLKLSGVTGGNLDLGFSLHNQMGETISVLYSSYQNKVYVPNSSDKYMYIRCKIRKFPFACKRLFVKGRLVLNGEEADWPKRPLGYVDIEGGDFYDTGNPGFNGNLTFLLKGEWE